MQLLEVVLDVGRKPVARFPDGDVTLTETPVSYEAVEYAAELVGEFKADNRAGVWELSRALRESCLRLCLHGLRRDQLHRNGASPQAKMLLHAH